MATDDDFFRARLDSMIDMRHPLAVLAHRLTNAPTCVRARPNNQTVVRKPSPNAGQVLESQRKFVCGAAELQAK